jgi:hypothetical protein
VQQFATTVIRGVTLGAIMSNCCFDFRDTIATAAVSRRSVSGRRFGFIGCPGFLTCLGITIIVAAARYP